jgi:hypothetical protein
MAAWRPTGTRCPLDEGTASMEKCMPCRFFRGASSPPREPWKMLCNWPRNGSDVEMPEVPQAFREAFD